MNRKLNNVTLLGIDCVNIDRLRLASEICQKDIDFADIKLLTSLSATNQSNIVKIEPIKSVEDYSRFVITELEKYVNTSHVLIIQYDGFILNPNAWTDEFLEYDYIGAPWLVDNWSVKEFGFPKELMGKLVVGNGGFSLRSKKFLTTCAQLAKDGAFKKYHPEDVVLSVLDRKFLEDRGMKFAPPELAKKFSFEAENDEYKKWDGQFGFHGLKWTDISNWTDLYPKYRALLSL